MLIKSAGLIPAGVILLVGMSAGCRMDITPAARRQLLGAYAAYQRGDDRAVVSGTTAFLAAAERSSRAAEACYLRGLALDRMGDRPAAIRDLRRAAADSACPRVQACAETALGDMAWQDGDLDTAGTYYHRAISHSRQGRPPSCQGHFRLARVLQRQGKWREADIHLSRVIYYWPRTPTATLAGRRIHARAWTIQAGAFTEKRRADTLAQTLREKTLTVNVLAARRDGKLIYLVRVGRYDSFKRARADLDHVKNHQSDAFLAVTR